MAIQNFLAGGYIGKLGETIGQGWKNKLVVKTYAKPSNPQTPKQTANRQIFKKAIELSQDAMNFNRGEQSWQAPDKTEFNRRVSQAKLRIQAGMSDNDATPYYPEGSTDIITPTDPVFSYNPASKVLTITWQAPILNADRVFSYQFGCWILGNTSRSIINGTIAVTRGSKISVSIPNAENTLFIESCWAELDTFDTQNHPNNDITLPSSPLIEDPPRQISIDMDALNFSGVLNQSSILFQFDNPYLPFPISLTGTAHYRNLATNQFLDEPITFTAQAFGRLQAVFAVSNTHTMDYPGCQISVPAGLFESPGVSITTTSTTKSGPWGGGQSYVLTNPSITWQRAAGTVTINFDGPIPAEDRQVRLTYRYWYTDAGQWRISTEDFILRAGLNPSLVLDILDDMIFTTGAWFKVDSRDDAAHNNTRLYFPQTAWTESPRYVLPWSPSQITFDVDYSSNEGNLYLNTPKVPLFFTFVLGSYERTTSSSPWHWSEVDIDTDPGTDCYMIYDWSGGTDWYSRPFRVRNLTQVTVSDASWQLTIPAFDITRPW